MAGVTSRTRSTAVLSRNARKPLIMEGPPAGPSARALERRRQRKRQAESDHPADIARRQAAKSRARAKLAAETPEKREARLTRYKEAYQARKRAKIGATAAGGDEAPDTCSRLLELSSAAEYGSCSILASLLVGKGNLPTQCNMPMVSKSSQADRKLKSKSVAVQTQHGRKVFEGSLRRKSAANARMSADRSSHSEAADVALR